MKKLQLSNKKIMAIGFGFVVIATSSFTASKIFQSKIGKEAILKEGANTCFNRVSQTFTALMIQDFNSNYLSQNFMDTTGECFSEAKSQFDALYAGTFKAGFKHINMLSSDLHWFHEKVQKLISMNKENNLEFNNSNITNKYSALETAKIDFQDAIQSKIDTHKKWDSALFATNLFSLVGFILSMGFLFVQRKNNSEAINHIEKEAEEMVKSDSEIVSAQFDRLIESALKRSGLPNTYSLFSKYHAQLLEKQYNAFESNDGIDIDAVRIETKGELESESENLTKAFFQDAIGTVLDHVGQKAFTHGILLDTKLEDDFWVKADQETLEQVLFSVLSYATESSLNQVADRKISLSSKALGGTALFKVKLHNYCFNANELNYLNGQEAAGDLGTNLILIHEMVKDLGASIAVKNRLNAQKNIEGSEIEILFERVEVKKTQKSISVVKGTKRDILNSINA